MNELLGTAINEILAQQRYIIEKHKPNKSTP